MDISPLLAPVVTIPVIAALAVTVVVQGWDAKRRLKRRLMDQAKLLGKLNSVMIAAIVSAAEKEMKRRVATTVTATVDETLKAIGMTEDEFENKLRHGGADDLLDRAIFGTSRKGRDPFKMFSLDDLAEALGGSHRQSPVDHAAEIFRGGATYDHNAGPLETAAAEGRTHADVQDDYKSDGGTTLGDMLREATEGGFAQRHSSGDHQSPRAG